MPPKRDTAVKCWVFTLNNITPEEYTSLQQFAASTASTLLWVKSKENPERLTFKATLSYCQRKEWETSKRSISSIQESIWKQEGEPPKKQQIIAKKKEIIGKEKALDKEKDLI